LVLVGLFSQPKQRWRHVAVWLVVAALIVGPYFQGWSAGSSVALNVLWEKPLVFIVWTLNFLGAPLLTYWLAWIFGGLSLVALLGAVIYVFPRYPLSLLAPYAAIIVFILGSALSIGVGRGGFSPSSAYVSRYLTMTVWYWAALLVLLPLSPLSPLWQNWLKVGLALMLCVGMIGGGILGYNWRYLRTLPAYQAARQGLYVSDEAIKAISTLRPGSLRQTLELFCQYNWSVCRK
jgi:hypothetical protein